MDLITYLDSVLKWSVEYLQDVAMLLASNCSFEDEIQIDKLKDKSEITKLFDVAKSLVLFAYRWMQRAN